MDIDGDANAAHRLRSNWGRWGKDDERGSLNLLTTDRVRLATRLVEHGRVVPMSRTIDPGSSATGDAEIVRIERRRYEEHPNAGAMVETYCCRFHGREWTHIDALGHVWDAPGMWNGRQPDTELDQHGSAWGDLLPTARGIVGRGVLFDVVSWRAGAFVTADRPVTADELGAIADAEALVPAPGDLLVVRSGRPEWEAANGAYATGDTRPGLDASVFDYLAETDCSVLISDMLDAKPHGLDRQWSVHAAIYLLGVHLVDNADLTEVAGVCAELGRHAFMAVLSPLPIRGATGSPVNPIAVF